MSEQKKQIFRSEWRNKSKHSKHVIDGQKYIMELDDKLGTCLVPIEIIKDEIKTTK